MSDKYEHEGKQFTTPIAMELIFKKYVWKSPVEEQTIREEVYQIHESCGGLPPKMKASQNISDAISQFVGWYVRQALSKLEDNGGATREEQLWQIHELDIKDIRKDIRSDEHTYPKSLGTESQEVYLYYYPAYRENAELKRPPVWKQFRKDALWRCKIGETHDQNTETRAGQQGRVAPETKVIALIMKTDDSRWLENMIHEILKKWGRHVKDADGKEWFRTSPKDVERIYNFLLFGTVRRRLSRT